MAKKTKIGIIGYGNMGSAIAKRIAPRYEVFIFDKDSRKTKNIAKAKVAKSIFDLVNNVDVVILAIKPQDFDEVLNEIKSYINEKLVISIAAGKRTGDIEKVLGKIRVVRVMPNLPAKIGKGMSCLCKGKFAKPNDLKFTRKIFDLLGETLILDENMMDKATAVSGSGPGFWCAYVENQPKNQWKQNSYDFFIPELSIVAEEEGFTKKQANMLAKSTALGSLATVESLDIPPAQLKKQIASKGGTTEAGLKKFLKGNLKFLSKAVKAAFKRAKELSNEAATFQAKRRRKVA